jgi:mannose-1-phosphate guanylyltransferase/mannose-6-phosphate isomerase-like protein (cupin superfamily)
MGQTPIIPVIVCGGMGKRLWPASTALCPKPFLALTHAFDTLFQQTLTRIDGAGFEPPLIVGNVAHRALIEAQLGGVKANLLLEPESRNTAPAIAMAALWVQQHYGDNAQLLVLPSDHAINNLQAFLASVKALSQRLKPQQLGLFGITPTRAEVGYGYIECDGERVLHFTEKPDAKRAEEYLRSGRHYWNSGMFLLPISALLQAYERLTPTLIYSAKRVFIQASKQNNALCLPKFPMRSLPYISIDYAIFQTHQNMIMQPLMSDWSDVGTWHSLWQTRLQMGMHNMRIMRPWGSFETVFSGPNYCVKHLLVDVGGTLSLQYHHHRAERWTVIRGEARVRRGDAHLTLRQGDIVEVPKGMKHRLENIGTTPLEVIEIQTGKYLGEDDIIRLEDIYGRHTPNLIWAAHAKSQNEKCIGFAGQLG